MILSLCFTCRKSLPLIVKLQIFPWSNLTSTNASLDIVINSGEKQPSGGSRDLNKSPVRAWTRHGPSRKETLKVNTK